MKGAQNFSLYQLLLLFSNPPNRKGFSSPGEHVWGLKAVNVFKGLGCSRLVFLSDSEISVHQSLPHKASLLRISIGDLI